MDDNDRLASSCVKPHGPTGKILFYGMKYKTLANTIYIETKPKRGWGLKTTRNIGTYLHI